MNLEDLEQMVSAVSSDAVVLSKFLIDWTQDNKAVLYVLLIFALGFVIGRYRGYRAYRASAYQNYGDYQNYGEAQVSKVVGEGFGPPDYHLMNHVTLRMEGGTTEVDHILVSRFGVFVIETKARNGWIFADAKQANWTQVLFNDKFKFQNPIHQNFRHVLAVQGLLDFLPPDAIKSVVVFTGEAEFKTETPQGVFSVSGLIDYLREQTVEVMSLNRVQFCVGRLETARLAISGSTDVEHVQSLERRHRSPTYPP